MRIGLYHGPLCRGAGGYETYGPYARYVHEFARHFDEVVVFAPVAAGDTDYRGCALEAPNVRVVGLPDFRTHIQASRFLWSIYRTFRHEIGNLGVINCRNTAPYGYLLYHLARPRGIGFFYHFTSDPWEILNVTPKYRGPFGWFARSAYRLDFAVQKQVMRRTYSFVNGRLPFERLRAVTDRIEPIISSTLTDADFYERPTYDLKEPVRLLYVGFLKHMKGLDFLIDALRILKDRRERVELHLVGAGPEEGALRSQVDRLRLTEQVHFHGYVAMGPALSRFYDEADIFVFPSLSEGSPRVVLEALAHSLPVVSTSVGSVPLLIDDKTSGLLVPLRDSGALAAAVLRYIRDGELRRRCARAGYSKVRRYTLEHFLAPLVRKAKELARLAGDDAGKT